MHKETIQVVAYDLKAGSRGIKRDAAPGHRSLDL
jgi:hypothetical protein